MLSPEDVSLDEFESMTEEAVRDLPAWVRDAVDDLAILVADDPTPDEHPSGRLLGQFRGIPRTRHGGRVPGSLPSTITLYRLPILRTTRDRDQLPRRIDAVLRHEIGHALGLSESQLRELGVA